MAFFHSKTSSQEPGFDLKGRASPVPDAVEDGLSSDSSSLAEDKTFLRVPGEDTYIPIDKYEGRHRWDPQFQWDPSEEKRLVRKIDLRICSWVCLTFFALQLDRANIVQALTDNMLDDLGITTNDYNYGQTIFYLCFLSAELPSQLISKKLGPDRWIPIQMVSWSLVASFQAFLSGKSSFYACRALLGLIEGGVSHGDREPPRHVSSANHFPSSSSLIRFYTCLIGTRAGNCLRDSPGSGRPTKPPASSALFWQLPSCLCVASMGSPGGDGCSH